MHSWIRVVVLAAMLPVLGLAQTRPSDVTLSPASSVQVERLAALEFPWGMAYLPDGRLLVTEKPGRLRIYADGKLSAPVGNLPAISYRESQSEQGGLLDVAVDPDFAQNRRVYLSYAEDAPQPSPAPVADDDPRFGGFLDLKDNRLRGGAVAAPVRTWTPVISPSGALFYDGSLFPWRGNVLLGGLSSKALIRLAVDGTKVTSEERIDMQRRIRDVIQARDGAVLVITDEKNGALLRVTPARQTRE